MFVQWLRLLDVNWAHTVCGWYCSHTLHLLYPLKILPCDKSSYPMQRRYTSLHFTSERITMLLNDFWVFKSVKNQSIIKSQCHNVEKTPNNYAFCMSWRRWNTEQAGLTFGLFASKYSGIATACVHPQSVLCSHVNAFVTSRRTLPVVKTNGASINPRVRAATSS